MISTRYEPSRYWQWRTSLVDAYEKPSEDTTIICEKQPKPEEMELLRAYVWDGVGLCKFKAEGDVQTAFNLLCFALKPDHRDPAWDLRHIPPADGHLLPECGYLGLRRKNHDLATNRNRT